MHPTVPQSEPEVGRNGTTSHSPDAPSVPSTGVLRRLARSAILSGGRWFRDLSNVWRRATPGASPHPLVRTSPTYLPLRRVLLTDGVSRTLFDEYADHRDGPRGEEETGWVLLGLREADEAIVLATLPAGTQREAGIAHVQFNALAQAVACRIVRQQDRRINMLGVVHTHPGSLRHPSDADYRGDRNWVGQLRGKEGIFGIGTADGALGTALPLGRHPKPHVQCLGKLCVSWYALAEGDAHYRPLPVELTLGPDLARPLHSVWTTIETHAERLDRLARQQAGVTLKVVSSAHGAALAVTIPLAEPGDAVRVLLKGDETRYLLERGGEVLTADVREDRIDQGVYLLLAELASLS